MLFILNLKNRVVHMPIHLYAFSMHQILKYEGAYIYFVEETVNAQLSDHLNKPEFFKLVKTYQAHAHSTACWKYNKNKCCFSYCRSLQRRQL